MDLFNLTIDVFTLNVWGIPMVSKHRLERITAIAAYLKGGTHDIICLQEVWDKNDFVFIKEKISSVYPYSHYFFSGVFGSGVCTFSKWPIEDVFFHAWPLNGYVHMIHHADWFGGKGVGLCKIKRDDISINLYTAHLHAEYSTEDMYLPHRVLQAFDVAEFIKLTSSNADLIILAGDLNTRPDELAFRIISEMGVLIDTYSTFEHPIIPNNEHRARQLMQMGTNERASNSYTDAAEGSQRPEGQRIDYILYHTGRNYNAKVSNYGLPLPMRVPGRPFSYSDHEAVTATIQLTKSPKAVTVTPQKEYAVTLSNAISICDDALSTLKYSAKQYLVFSLTIFVLLISTVGMAERMCFDIPRLLLVVIMFYFIFMGTLWNCIEHNGVLSGKQAMEIIHRNLMLNEDDQN